MAEQPDKDSKTEEASPRRIEEALQKGNTPFSREVGNIASLLGAGLLLPAAASHGATQAVPSLAAFIDGVADVRLESSRDAAHLAWQVAVIIVAASWPIIVGLIVIGVASSLLQNWPSAVLHRIKPDIARVSPTKGLQRLLGAQGRMEFLKALIKCGIVVVVFHYTIAGGWQRVRGYILTSHHDLPYAVITEAADVLFATGLCMALLAAADVAWSRWKWRGDLRMARHEVKEEQKQAEGDPMVRARQRSLARNLARRRMMAAVPRATLVVANPTHYAIAMRYVHGESSTPIVVAKGIDHIALRIREIAQENGIPVVEDPVLARSLYGAVKADRPIPPEFYRAVAEIILFLMSRQIRSRTV